MVDFTAEDEADWTEIAEEIADERRREIVAEHLLFQTISFIERRNPGLIDHLEASIEHLGDPADDETKDDEAARDIARLFIRSLRGMTG